MPESEDRFLNQNELDSLLNGINNSDDPEQEESPKDSNIDNELDTLLDMIGEIANIAMGSGATTLSTLLRRKIEIQYPQTDIIKFKNIVTNFEGENVVVTVEYKKGLYGLNTLVLPLNLTNIIADLMLGKEVQNIEERELDDISLSAISEAMNQMMGTASTALSDFLKTNIDISPPNTKVMNFSDPNVEFPPIETDKEAYVISIKFTIKISGIAETTFWQFIPMKFAKKIKELMEKTFGKVNKNKESPINSNKQDKSNSKVIKEKKIKVQPVEFGEFEKKEEPISQNIDLSRLELLLDVPLEIKVELGSTKLNLREILELHEGSMIQLNKLAGEPLDIFANGRLIARGEVVVIDENFGIRITEIVSLRERMKTLK
ncbi:flagellar motor switch phosphatase FliY [Petrotoga olearia]|uniref:Chemotaxis protein CheC n=2 Tax=Petrotoga olearia TaxID=156203 RepID=A0A2K1NWT5_9BACT|nr:flagellar motor switch phosphatase FliY [Petrotoga olearia]PNR94998.1 chemotaxis protein CheC [Petrotoga olearia DSM 13574]RMA73309.1 flagellar motor switch protein FliN/FliY [Petrotoga olearia]